MSMTGESPPPRPATPAAAPPRGALSPVTWVIGLAVVVAVILYVVTR
jgi:hypothetical protein